MRLFPFTLATLSLILLLMYCSTLRLIISSDDLVPFCIVKVTVKRSLIPCLLSLISDLQIEASLFFAQLKFALCLFDLILFQVLSSAS